MTLPPDTFEVPQGATVQGFTVQRLGVCPSFSVTLAETVADTLQFFVAAMVESETPGEYTGFTVTLPTLMGLGLPTHVVGQPVVLADASVVGTVAAVEGVQLTLAAPITEDITGQTVTVQQVNAFGIPALRPSQAGRRWDLLLSSSVPTHLARMQQLMGLAHVHAVLVVLEALGVSKTPEEVQAAVMGASENLESILATQFEQLELERRANTFVGSTMGVLPR